MELQGEADPQPDGAEDGDAFPSPDHAPVITADTLITRSALICAQQSELQQLRDEYGEANLHVTQDNLQLVVRENTATRIAAPPSIRDQLIMQIHQRLKHARLRKVLTELQRLFTWKNMRADVVRVLTTCTTCATLKARLNRAHGQFRMVEYKGPRRAYGVDFYSVASSADGMNTIMTVIDLYSRWVQFFALPDRTAETFCRVFLQHIVWVRGCPSVLVSDGAPEFVGRLASALCSTLRITRITTRHWPQGNAITERVHVLLGEGLRLLAPRRRPYWPQELAPIAFAHNATVHATMDLSPFEVEHGEAARTPEAAVLSAPPPASSLPPASRTDGVFSRITDAAELYRTLAARNARARRTEENARLNRTGGTPVVYSPGDHVAVYVPTLPRAGQNWRSKHMLQWRGPCVVVSRDSTSMYTVRLLSSGRTFSRSVSCLSPWRAPVRASAPPVPGNNSDSDDSDTDSDDPVGDIWAVLDSPDAKSFDLVKVLAVHEDYYHVHCLSAAQDSLARARFKPAYIETASGKLIRGGPRGARATPWTWDLPMDAPELLLTKGIRLRSTGHLTAASRRLLCALHRPHTVH